MLAGDCQRARHTENMEFTSTTNNVLILNRRLVFYVGHAHYVGDILHNLSQSKDESSLK